MTASPEPHRPARRYHGFDALRIFAALAVVLTHSFPLTGHADDRPMLEVGHYRLAFGNLGISIFFVTSGFLVAQSWERTAGAVDFARNRVARIWPALTVLVLGSVFVLGPLVTDLPLGTYFRDRLTVDYLWRNLTLVFGAAFRLPGVFADQPSAAVNGSLWTLPYEVYAYLALGALGLTGVLRRRWAMVAVFVAFLFTYRFGVYSTDLPIRWSRWGLSTTAFVALGTWFFAGAALATWRSRVPQRLVLPGAALAVAWVVVSDPTLLYLGVAALTIGLGTSALPGSSRLHRLGDPSYGIYIFSFPIQQLLVRSEVVTTPLPLFALAAPLSIAAGYLSWHAVERPALRFLKRGRVALDTATESGTRYGPPR